MKQSKSIVNAEDPNTLSHSMIRPLTDSPVHSTNQHQSPHRSGIVTDRDSQIGQLWFHFQQGFLPRCRFRGTVAIALRSQVFLLDAFWCSIFPTGKPVHDKQIKHRQTFPLNQNHGVPYGSRPLEASLPAALLRHQMQPFWMASNLAFCCLAMQKVPGDTSPVWFGSGWLSCCFCMDLLKGRVSRQAARCQSGGWRALYRISFQRPGAFGSLTCLPYDFRNNLSQVVILQKIFVLGCLQLSFHSCFWLWSKGGFQNLSSNVGPRPSSISQNLAPPISIDSFTPFQQFGPEFSSHGVLWISDSPFSFNLHSEAEADNDIGGFCILQARHGVCQLFVCSIQKDYDRNLVGRDLHFQDPSADFAACCKPAKNKTSSIAPNTE